MNNFNSFIQNVQNSRKRTGIIYTSEVFSTILQQLQESNINIEVLDCTSLYHGSLIFPAGELLNEIELASGSKPGIITNIETFIVSNSFDFAEQLAKLLTMREPLKPLFFLFYSKKIFAQFKMQFESKDLNQNNIIEI